jgi:hypothetical protein
LLSLNFWHGFYWHALFGLFVGAFMNAVKAPPPVETLGVRAKPQQSVSTAKTKAIAAVRALQDQELIAQGKDFSLQSCASSEAGWGGRKQGGEKGKHASGRLHSAALRIQPLQ